MKFVKKKKRNDEIKRDKKYPDARKLYDQQPEFTFSKVVQALSAKPETKTAYTQYNVQNSKITESYCRKKGRNQIHVLNLHHRKKPEHNHKQVRKTNKICHQINRRKDKQMLFKSHPL